MKLMRIETVASDAVTANTPIIIDVEGINEITPTAANTCKVTGTFGVVTFTTDGEDDTERLLNCNKICDFIAAKVQEICGPNSAQRGVVDLFRGKSYANFEADTGIANTGSTGPLVTVALS